MPVYHFIYHAYRSWNADHPKGWVQRGEPGVRARSESLAAYRDGIASFPPVEFSTEHQSCLYAAARDICGRRGWRFHCFASEPTHVHVVVAWRGEADSEFVKDTLKRLLGLLLARHAGTKGQPWFSVRSGDERVLNRGQLRHLLYEYLPKHGGVFWREEMPPTG